MEDTCRRVVRRRLASSTGNGSDLPSDDRGKPNGYRSTNRQGTYRSLVREGRKTLPRNSNLSIHNGNRFSQAGERKSCGFIVCVGNER